MKLIYLIAAASALFSCGNTSKTNSEPVQTNVKETTETVQNNNSSFNADSAYYYIDKQVSFGHRVPNTPEHKACAAYLASELERHGAKVFVQEANVEAYDGTNLNIQNIIGSYNPENKNRILLFAHWDTRPYADKDANPKNYHTSIDGADDGASGVGVLLELARQFNLNKPEVGIDIIFFDAEDYGTPEFVKTYKPNTWCLGSQFWAKNPHIPGYSAKYGILLDMVGAKNAVFYKEYTSVRFAARYVELIWETARNLGYGKYFINDDGGAIVDDHQYVIEGRNIPCVDIINYDPETETGFPSYHHTINDNMKLIDKATLKAVGHTVMEVVYKK